MRLLSTAIFLNAPAVAAPAPEKNLYRIRRAAGNIQSEK